MASFSQENQVSDLFVSAVSDALLAHRKQVSRKSHSLECRRQRRCESQVELWMQQGKHNTSVKPKYFQLYLDLAAKYGYVAHVIHAEAVILPSGDRPGNIHGVPAEILERQKANWEVFNAINASGNF